MKQNDAALAAEAVELATELLKAASKIETREQRKHRKQLARMLADERSRQFTLELADEVIRIRDPERAAARLRELVAAGLPPFLMPQDRALMRAGAVSSLVLPHVVMPLVANKVRQETESVLLPVEEPALRERVVAHHAEFIRMNLNLLGEAILGEEEAVRRVNDVVELLRRPHIDYVSVKISAICSQLDVLAFDESVERIVDRLRILYRAAQETFPPKFVNLDMEEYRDLHLTIAAFTATLDEAEFHTLDAGIVLQAYLPDSFGALQQLCEWAVARRARGGGRIKIRIVKGANLAMEHVDAELHGWTSAPFETKAQVDANYKRMLDLALSEPYADAVRVGVASHNLFDVAWALVLRKHLNAEHRVEIEMLEGMAPPQSSAVASHSGGLLLYGPATSKDGLESAVAYLARRLDENAAPENFLHSLFTMKPGDAEFEEEKAKFLRAIDERHQPPSRPRRTLTRIAPRPVHHEGFFNEPDTDFTHAVNRRWIHDALDHWEAPPMNWPVPTVEDVDTAVESARIASDKWRSLGFDERRAILGKVADEMARERGNTIAAMANTTGKTVTEGDVEVSEAVDFARYYAEASRQIEEIQAKGAHFEPHRVTVIASPWNFPYAIPAGGVLAALAAGSSVILKPAPQSRLIAQLVVDHCRRGGVPDDVVQFLPCDDDHAGKHLITHDDVNAVVLTGSWDTAKMFRSWKPQLALHAETSGKNALVITAAADLDAAVRDLVRSAFGNAGQKCSAASLAIVEASVYDDPRFPTRLADAVRSLRVGTASSVDTYMGPLIEAPTGNLLRALTTLDEGESWLVEPRRLSDALWTPGVKWGVKAGAWFHTAECFGPVLGVMRADSLEQAIVLQNATPFGLTAGLHSLDPAEITRWVDRVDAGNLYVNRHITGAIVNRQPFGGWKKSVMGPATKAGGPNYVLTMGTWTDAEERDPNAATDYEQAWAEHFAVPHDPSALKSESNDFRYIPYYRPVVIRVGEGATIADVERAREAAHLAGVTVIVARDSDDDFIKHVRRIKPSKVRVLGRTSNAIYKRCDELGIAVDDSPVTSIGRLELQHWVHEQVVSITRHRYGNVRDYSYAPASSR